MHLFAGCRREGDLEDWLTRLAEEAGLKLLILSVDLADDPAWDLSEPETFMRLRELVSESLIDAVFGGPRPSLRHLEPTSLSSRRTSTPSLPLGAVGPRGCSPGRGRASSRRQRADA